MKVSVEKIKNIMNEEVNSLLSKENKQLKLSKEFADKFFECFDLEPSKNKILYEKVYKTFSKNQKMLESVSGVGNSALTARLLNQAPPRAVCIEYFKKIMQEKYESQVGDGVGEIVIEKGDLVEGHSRHISFRILGEDANQVQTFTVWYVSIDNDEFHYAHGTDVFFTKRVLGNITINGQEDDQRIEGVRLYGEW